LLLLVGELPKTTTSPGSARPSMTAAAYFQSECDLAVPGRWWTYSGAANKTIAATATAISVRCCRESRPAATQGHRWR
jgi:hypothetical protein